MLPCLNTIVADKYLSPTPLLFYLLSPAQHLLTNSPPRHHPIKTCRLVYTTRTGRHALPIGEVPIVPARDVLPVRLAYAR